MSARMATLHEMDSVYGLSDVYDMIEIIMIDAQNQRLLSKKN